MAKWDPRKWIGIGKSYPKTDIPPEVSAAREQALAVPEEYRSHYPNRAMTIPELLNAELPVQIPVLVTAPAWECFRIEEPNEDLTVLKTRPIPPQQWLHDAVAAFGQAWFDGARSIVDWRFKQSRLPFWVLTYWQALQEPIRDQAQWNVAQEWLDLHSRGKAHVDAAGRVLSSMHALSWGAEITALNSNTPVRTLLRLLSDEWLDDEIINMSMRLLSTRCRSDEQKRTSIIIAPLSFWSLIQSSDGRGSFGNALLRRYKHLIQEGGRTRLYFPSHINNNHWVPFEIDFTRRTVAYGKHKHNECV